MTMKVRCLHKYRNGNNQILGYKIQNTQGETIDVSAEQLKMYMYSKQMDVVNLQLTRDGRLIDKPAEKFTSGTNEEFEAQFLSIIKVIEGNLGLPYGSIAISDKVYDDNTLIEIRAVSDANSTVNYKGSQYVVGVGISKADNNFDMHLYNNNLGYECDTDLKIKGSIIQNEDRIRSKIKSFLTKVHRGM